MWILQGGFHTSLRHGCSRERGRRRKELWDIKLARTTSGSRRGDVLHSGAVGITDNVSVYSFCIVRRQNLYVDILKKLITYSLEFPHFHYYLMNPNGTLTQFKQLKTHTHN